MDENETNKDMQQIIFGIITDHILYSCSVETLEMWKKRIGDASFSLTESEVENMELRKKVLKYVRNKQSGLAFKILWGDNMFDIFKEEDRSIYIALAKLTFLDYIEENRIEEAIGFAKEHLDKKKDFEKLYTLIGYEEISKDVLEKVNVKMDRSAVLNSLNAFLFSKLTGRKCSLLHSAVDYYNTLMNVQ